MATKNASIRSTLDGALAHRLWLMRDEDSMVPRWLAQVVSDDLANRMVIQRGSLRITLSIVKKQPVAVVDHVRGVRYANLNGASAASTRARSSLFVEQSIQYFSLWTRKRAFEEYWRLTASARNELLKDARVAGGYRLWSDVDAAPSVQKKPSIIVRDSRIDPIIYHPVYEFPIPRFGN